MERLLPVWHSVGVSRKDEAAQLLLDGQDVAVVAAATGLQNSTVTNIARRLAQPLDGDSSFCGTGHIRCKGCGQPCVTHSIRSTCAALATPY
ncbi:MAG: hypothetical protein GY906_10390 [bacterium]|nr:hypothetical protein [bacterium]